MKPLKGQTGNGYNEMVILFIEIFGKVLNQKAFSASESKKYNNNQVIWSEIVITGQIHF